MQTPIYSATKRMYIRPTSLCLALLLKADTLSDGLIGFTRSIGKKLWEEGIKVNAICPGVVETPLLTPELKSIFGKSVVAISSVTDVVMEVLSGSEMVDSKGVAVSSEEMHSRAILISGENHYFVEMPEIYDEETQITQDAMMGG